jgi:protein-arginine kinase activator protein McsA
METVYASFFCQNCGQAIQLHQSLLSSTSDQSDFRGHLSQRLSVADKLFRLVTKESKIEQPICDECAQELLDLLESKLLDLQKERDSYRKYSAEIPDQLASIENTKELEFVYFKLM